MKNKFSPLIFLLITLFLLSCNDNESDIGVSIQPTKDEILVAAKTFRLESETFKVNNIVSKPDSFLLGTYIDDVYGTTQADILSQLLLAKKDYTFMDKSIATTVPDSVVLTLGFDSYFGVSSSPMKIDVYEMNKDLIYKENYKSDLDVSKYANLSQPIGSTVATVINPLTQRNNTSIKIKLNKNFLNHFFTTNPNIYKSQESFQKHFKGLYITTKQFGSSTMLQINKIFVTMYYHYKYLDSGEIVKTYLRFPVSSEVKSVNRIEHPVRLINPNVKDEYNYLVAPANYYTRVRIPLKKIKENIDTKGKRLTINGANLTINVLNKDNLNLETYIPYVEDLLLVKESELNNFFVNNDMPSDTVSFVAKLQREKLAQNKYKYFYSFNSLAKLIETELKKEDIKDVLNFVLVPITTRFVTQRSGYYNTTQILSEIRENTKMEAVAIYSGNNSKEPMSLEVVYSGF
ncbi:MAG: hypothetical protein CR965_01240 [Paludibacter sp.]|nr:MAG: hypothetical protein CR965_01240 [Paludibacter sp.]